MTRRVRRPTLRPLAGAPPPALSISVSPDQIAAVAAKVGVPPGVLQTLLAIAVAERPAATLAAALRAAADLLERKTS